MANFRWLARTRLTPWAWGAIGVATVLLASPMIRKGLRRGAVGVATGAIAAGLALAEARNKIKGAWELLVEEIRARRSNPASADEVKADVMPEET